MSSSASFFLSRFHSWRGLTAVARPFMQNRKWFKLQLHFLCAASQPVFVLFRRPFLNFSIAVLYAFPETSPLSLFAFDQPALRRHSRRKRNPHEKINENESADAVNRTFRRPPVRDATSQLTRAGRSRTFVSIGRFPAVSAGSRSETQTVARYRIHPAGEPHPALPV